MNAAKCNLVIRQMDTRWSNLRNEKRWGKVDKNPRRFYKPREESKMRVITNEPTLPSLIKLSVPLTRQSCEGIFEVSV